MTRPVLITPPAVLPVTLAAAKNYLRVDDATDDDLITLFIGAATDQAELYTGRCFIHRTYRLTLDAFPASSGRDVWWDGVRQGAIGELTRVGPILLGKLPLASVTGILTYDAAGIATAVDPATYSISTYDGEISLRSGAAWPVNLRRERAIEITFVAGYGATPADVPPAIRTAILNQVAQSYEARTCGDLSDAAMGLLGPYRIMRL